MGFRRQVPHRDILESASETAALVLAMDQVALAMADSDQAFMDQGSVLASAVIVAPAMEIRIMVTRRE